MRKMKEIGASIAASSALSSADFAGCECRRLAELKPGANINVYVQTKVVGRISHANSIPLYACKSRKAGLKLRFSFSVR